MVSGRFSHDAGARRVPKRLRDRDLGAAGDASRALGSLGLDGLGGF